MFKEMKIRPCMNSDLNKVIEIESECFEQPYPEDVFTEYLGDDLFLVADHKGDVLGYVISDVRKNEGVIISIAVDPSFQRQGIGKRLIDKTTDLLSTKYVVLTVRINNISAQNFYEELDFEKLYVINEYYENDEDAIVMGKKLQKDE
ncbi:MAG: ribosomal protein S18-alanine N-acetyltransferase [Thermoplasmatota archaeon]